MRIGWITRKVVHDALEVGAAVSLNVHSGGYRQILRNCLGVRFSPPADRGRGGQSPGYTSKNRAPRKRNFDGVELRIISASRTLGPANAPNQRRTTIRLVRQPARRRSMDRVDQTLLTPLLFLERSARALPDRVAITHGEKRYSYEEMAGEATRLARALQASGIAAGDRVAYLCPNIPEMLIAHFGVPLAHAVLVAINIRLSSNEIEYILNHSGAKILVIDTSLMPLSLQFATIWKPSRRSSTSTTRASIRHSMRHRSAPCSSGEPTIRSPGPLMTKTGSSRSTTPPARPAGQRASCTRIAAPT